jgi:TonB family protein
VKAATLALSVSAHAAVAFVAAHGGGSSAVAGPGPLAELPAPELVTLGAPPIENPSGEAVRAEPDGHRAHHKHPYAVRADHDATPHDPSVPHIPLLGQTTDRPNAPPSAIVDVPSTAPARFVLTVGSQPSVHGGVVSANGGESETPSASAAPFGEDTVDTAATLLSGGAPAYTREAESARVEAEVPLEIVVDDRGEVVAARALRRAGFGLDEVALRSVRAYRFKPARRAGHPVPVRMRWLVRFELR